VALAGTRQSSHDYHFLVFVIIHLWPEGRFPRLADTKELVPALVRADTGLVLLSLDVGSPGCYGCFACREVGLIPLPTIWALCFYHLWPEGRHYHS